MSEALGKIDGDCNDQHRGFVVIFALRGVMLSFINLFVRIVLLMTGYIVACACRGDVALELAKQMEHVSPYSLQVIASVGLFCVVCDNLKCRLVAQGFHQSIT